MSERPLRAIALLLIGLSALPCGALALALAGTGRADWALGVIAGWLAGSLNEALLAVRVSRLTARSSVVGFLYGAASRFALIALTAIVAYRSLGAAPLGFALGIALVVLMNVPASLIWWRRGEPAR